MDFRTSICFKTLENIIIIFIDPMYVDPRNWDIQTRENNIFFKWISAHYNTYIDPMYVDTYGTKKGQPIPGSYRKPIGFYRQWNIFYR